MHEPVYLCEILSVQVFDSKFSAGKSDERKSRMMLCDPAMHKSWADAPCNNGCIMFVVALRCVLLLRVHLRALRLAGS